MSYNFKKQEKTLNSNFFVYYDIFLLLCKIIEENSIDKFFLKIIKTNFILPYNDLIDDFTDTVLFSYNIFKLREILGAG